ncbi:MAG TPA: hypothetical protein P5077_06380 [bacterium]|nr:hypothetical protein [bacterium]
MRPSLVASLAIFFLFSCVKERAPYAGLELAGPGEHCGGMVFCESWLVCRDGYCEELTPDIDDNGMNGSDPSDPSDLPDPPELSDSADTPALPDEEAAPDADLSRLCDGSIPVTAATLPYFISCDTISGDLVIEDTLLDAIEGLKEVRRVDGSLIIRRNVLLTDLSGLRRLQKVGGSVTVEYNARLTDLGAVSALLTVGNELRIKGNGALTRIGLPAIENAFTVWVEHNDQLADLDLPRLSTVSGTLYLLNNRTLTSLDGTPSLSAVGRIILQENDALSHIAGTTLPLTYLSHLEVRDNPRFSSLRGLGTLVTAGTVILDDAPLLTSLEGLDMLSQATSLSIERCGIVSLNQLKRLYQLNGDLILRDNPALIHLSGPVPLSFIGGALVIHRNPALIDLVGLPALRSAGAVSLMGNNALNSIAGMASVAMVYGPVEILGNPALKKATSLISLRSVNGGLAFMMNDAATEVAFPSLETAGGDIAVSYNPLLADMTFPALSALDGDLHVEENPALPSCQAEELRDRLTEGYGWEGLAVIQGNDPAGACR